MKFYQQGFGGLQLLMVVVVIGAISTIAVPKYEAYMTRAKLTEAFGLAGESKRKLSVYYMTNNGFPKNSRAAEALKTVSLSHPEIVDHMVVEPNSEDHDVIVKVFLKENMVENPTGDPQYVYIAGDQARGTATEIMWTCGARGVNPELLPDDCRG